MTRKRQNRLVVLHEDGRTENILLTVPVLRFCSCGRCHNTLDLRKWRVRWDPEQPYPYDSVGYPPWNDVRAEAVLQLRTAPQRRLSEERDHGHRDA